jgi:hypothetical protein
MRQPPKKDTGPAATEPSVKTESLSTHHNEPARECKGQSAYPWCAMARIEDAPTLTLAEHAILLAAPRWTDESGSLYPSVAKWAKQARVHPRTAQRVIRKMEERGLVVDIGLSPMGTRLYWIPLLAKDPPAQGAASDHPPPASDHAPPGVASQPPRRSTTQTPNPTPTQPPPPGDVDVDAALSPLSPDPSLRERREARLRALRAARLTPRFIPDLADADDLPASRITEEAERVRASGGMTGALVIRLRDWLEAQRAKPKPVALPKPEPKPEPKAEPEAPPVDLSAIPPAELERRVKEYRATFERDREKPTPEIVTLRRFALWLAEADSLGQGN